MSTFLTATEVLQEMLDDLQGLTGQKFAVTDLNRDEVISLFPIAGAISSFYSSLVQTDDDFYPQSASEQALEKHLLARQLLPRIQPGPAQGNVQFTTSTPGTDIPVGTQIQRVLTGDIYVSTVDVVVAGDGTAVTNFQSLNDGQNLNIAAAGEVFTLKTAISGINSDCATVTPMSDGRNLETPAQMLARIEAHDQNLNTGGNLAAYEAWAQAASPLVVTAKAIKTPRGPSTVNTVITSGTTDIAAAVLANIAVVRIPSDALVALVQAYILTQNPVTDDHETIKPTETSFNLTFKYELYDETQRALTDPVIIQQAKIFLYSAISGTTIYPAQFERIIDAQIGHLIEMRRCLDFVGSLPDGSFPIPAGQILTPGTLTSTTF